MPLKDLLNWNILITCLSYLKGNNQPLVTEHFIDPSAVS